LKRGLRSHVHLENLEMRQERKEKARKNYRESFHADLVQKCSR